MTVLSNNDIARSIYLISKDKSKSEQVDISKKIVTFLSRKRLLSKAPEILSRLTNIVNQEEGRVIAKVGSVEKLDNKSKTHIEQALKKRYHANEVLLVERLDATLLGGIKVEIDNEVIDLSIKNKIGKLQAHLNKD